MTQPYSFDEFFSSNQEESVSPFLTPDSRKWGKNLPLKSTIVAGILLLLAFGLSFIDLSLAFLCLSGVYFFAGTPALINAIHDLRNFEINIDVLMTLAALLSVAINSQFEGALLLVLFEFSGAMESTVTRKTRSSILSLRRLSPRTTFFIDKEGAVYERSVKELKVGDLILIKIGEIVPLDGEVAEGRSYVNLVHLTGESEPVLKVVGDEVAAGAHNLDGTLTLRVKRVSADSTLSRIIKLITEAQETKPKIEQFLKYFGKRYAILVILLVIFFAFFLPIAYGIPYSGREGSIYRVLTFLIAASPCALIIATPTAYLSALSCCARRGILLKGGTFLEAAAQCKIIAFDKTGTLTSGVLKCTEIKTVRGPPLEKNLALLIAASLEKHAVHPMAKAILDLATTLHIQTLPVQELHSIPGYGLEGKVGSFLAKIGHAEFVTDTPLPESDTATTYLLVQESIVAFHFEDPPRPGIALLLEELKKEKLRLVMLSGDHASHAHKVAKQIGIEEVFADLRPENKLSQVEALIRYAPLMMVGDGINDAPALTRATVGISMGKMGSSTAVNASDIIFINDNLSLLGWFLKKCFQTQKILKENISLALSIILLATTPALLGFLPLWVIVILHEGGTVLVGLNSLRLLKK